MSTKELAKELMDGLAANGVQVHVQQKSAKKAKKVAAPTTATPPPAPAPEPDLLAQIMAVDTGAVAKAIGTASQIVANPAAVEKFVGLMDEAWNFANLKLGYEPDWKDLGEMERDLRTWAPDDGTAGQIIQGIGLFETSKVDIVSSLWEAYTKIIGLARGVKGFRDLAELLDYLEDHGSVRRLKRGEHGYRDGIAGTGGKVYVPDSPEATRGWPWLEEARDRAKAAYEKRHEVVVSESDQRLVELRESTKDITPEAALSGESGELFLELGHGKCVLLEFCSSKVYLLETVGMPAVKYDPDKVLGYNDQGKGWPDVRIYSAFRRWIDAAVQTAAAAEAAATSVATEDIRQMGGVGLEQTSR